MRTNSYYRLTGKGAGAVILTRFVRVPKDRVVSRAKVIAFADGPPGGLPDKLTHARWVLFRVERDYDGRPDIYVFRLDGRSVRYTQHVVIDESERFSEV